MARLIDADAFDEVLQNAQTECKKNGGNFRYGVLSNVRANLAKMPTVCGWVSVKDRMPEDNVRVLVYSQTPKAMFVDKITDKKWWVLPEAYEVTHWMPIPEPPKEGKVG